MSINESWVWKEDLTREVAAFKRRCRAAGSEADRGARDEKLDMACEKFVFSTAFVVRKLIESKKLSDQMVQSRCVAYRSPRVGPPRNEFQELKLYESRDFWTREKRYYDLDLASRDDLRPQHLANLVIHSQAFLPMFDVETLDVNGFLVNSDWKNDWIWRVDFEAYIDLLKRVAKDHVVAVHVDRVNGVERRMNSEAASRYSTSTGLLAESTTP